jgi:HD-GYP domain-containing protein (c-di-GMP phosphodiesterase class II)
MSYVPIRLKTLRPDVPVLFDVFVLVANKYIHYINKVELFEGRRLDKLQEKGVKKVFVKAEDETLYLAYLDQGLNTLKNKNISTQAKAGMAHDTLVTDISNAERSFQTQDGYSAVRGRVGLIIDFLGSEVGALKSILDAAGVAVDNDEHGANVASLATGLALRVGGVQAKDIGDLALAAMVHDIGKAKLGFASPIDFNTLSADQQKEYRKHPDRAFELLSSKKYVTPAILRLVMEHEEYGEARGYPEKKFFTHLSPSSQMLSLCNHFDTYASLKKLRPLEAMSVFRQERGQHFDLNLIQAMADLIAGK